MVESYVSRMASQLPAHFAFATLAPWRSPQRPSRLAAPDSAPEGHWDAEVIASLASECNSLLVPCTFKTRYEKRVMKKLMEQLEPHGDFCVYVLQLLEVPGEMSREYVQAVMPRHDALLAVGANAVVLDPGDDPDRLRHKLDQERAWFEANAKRAHSMVVSNDEHFHRVLKYHHKLLWEAVPEALMPKFDPIDRNLVETRYRVGNYQLTNRFRARSGTVLLADRSESEKLVLKVYDKSICVSVEDLECIDRELRFLRDRLRHPHIVRCSSMHHSFSRVYLALEFGGMQNLHQRLHDQPGYRLDLEDAVGCAMQIAGALAYCHSRDVVHRQVSLEHIIVDDQYDKLFCRLVDFNRAACCPDSTPSVMPCGDLPCIAPEMALDESYFAKPADCWSLGVVLLEAAGGLGSMKQAVGWLERAELEPTARRIGASSPAMAAMLAHWRSWAACAASQCWLSCPHSSSRGPRLGRPWESSRSPPPSPAAPRRAPRGQNKEGLRELERELSLAPSLPTAQ
ncbi:unnamed protein product [Prorocentrum cordatum]|uniref:Protein kinase domain-containing protein n=1 Tax=Prorocentrum cordatum TaxID=2364126 RepID=A0ABN9XFG3_9DINO|nr:unnamed protein product [Polarella glacialis]